MSTSNTAAVDPRVTPAVREFQNLTDLIVVEEL
jgi:hypothetical protein